MPTDRPPRCSLPSHSPRSSLTLSFYEPLTPCCHQKIEKLGEGKSDRLFAWMFHEMKGGLSFEWATIAQRQTDRQTYIQTDRQPDSQTARQTDKQNRHTGYFIGISDQHRPSLQGSHNVFCASNHAAAPNTRMHSGRSSTFHSSGKRSRHLCWTLLGAP